MPNLASSSVEFYSYFFTLLTSGRSEIDYSKHVKWWNPM
jgi:hypothetical protein